MLRLIHHRRAVFFRARASRGPDVAESKKRKKNGHGGCDDTRDPELGLTVFRLAPFLRAPTFVALMILGLLWVVVYYIWSGTYPVPKLGRGTLRWVWAR